MNNERPAVERVRPPKGVYRYVNRVMVWMLTSPRRSRRLGEHLLLLHVTGRKSGRALTIPVGHRLGPDGRRIVLTGAPWRINLRDHPDVEVTLHGRRRPAHAELVEDRPRVASIYRDLIAAVGHEKAGRQMGLRINVNRVPTLDELEDTVRRDGLAVIHLAVED